MPRRDLRAFIGTVGYYRRFIRDFAKFHAILSPSTSSKAPGTVQWTPEMLNAFHCLRHGLSEYVILNIPCVSDSFQLHTDASGVGVGAPLHVIRSGSVLLVGFYSRKLKGAELRYSATELEALAVVESIRDFDHFLYGAQFEVLTDHKPLTSLLSSKKLNRLHANKNFNCALRNAVTGARETQRIDCLVGG